MAYRTAWRICSANRWWSVFGKRKRGKAGRPGPPVDDDLCAVTDELGDTLARYPEFFGLFGDFDG